MSNTSKSGGNSEFAFFDFLDLPGCRTIARDLIEHILLVRASYELFPDACPYCKARCLRSEDPRELVFWDVPLGHPTLVQLFVSDATCLACGKFLKTEPARLHPRREMTLRLIDHILARMATQSTFTQVALDTGQDLQTIIDVFMDAFAKWDAERRKDLPIQFGIDEAHFVPNRIYTILVDSGGTRGTIDVLPNRENATIGKRLKAAPNAKDVTHQTQDFSGPFRDVATKPFAIESSEASSTSQEAGPVEVKTFETPLFGEIPLVNAFDSGRDDYVRTHPDAVAPPLPNADIVGDHWHFSKEVIKGFIAVWSHVRKFLSDYLFQAEMAKFSDGQIAQMGKEAAEAHARAKADEDLEETRKKLYGFRFALRRGSEKRAKETIEEKRIIKALLDDLPLLNAAWDVKNSGLEIFPHKPRASRSKAARNAAKSQEAAAAVPPVDVEEVARKLDEWAEMSEELKPFFKKALGLVSGWRPELLRIASTGLNNGKAEAKVSQLRTFNRMGRGLTFDLLRARQLWFDAFHRTNRWPSFCDDIKGNITSGRFIDLVDAMLETGENAPEPTGDEVPKESLTEADASPATEQVLGPEADQGNSSDVEVGAGSNNNPASDTSGKGRS
jgi:transposase